MRTEELPIFPLTGVVLFPEVQAPLHIFERRYRQMTEAALAGSRQIGMVVIAREHAHETAGDPPLHPVGCTGRIRQAQKLPDGRYNLVLEGTRRFRILEEPARPAERLYRVAKVEPLDDPFPAADCQAVTRLRDRIATHLAELRRRNDPEHPRKFSEQIFRGVGDAAFVNSLCQALSFPTDEKLALLDAPDLLSRCELLEGLLSFRVAGLGAGRRRASETVH